MMKPLRPFTITLLCLLFLGLAALYLARLWNALDQWSILLELLPLSPIYLVLTGLFWAIVGFVIAVIIWLRRRQAPRLTRIFLVVYTIYYWLEYGLLVEHTGRSANWLFLAIINLVLVLWVVWVLSRPTTKTYFGENNERRP